MSKAKTHYRCQACANVSLKWQGQCPDCGAWNTLLEETVSNNYSAQAMRFDNYAQANMSQLVPLAEVAVENDSARLNSGLAEFDRVLGGGLVPGSVILLGGDPGIGKSTLLLQCLCDLSARVKALYITGEESLAQVSLRAQRLQLSSPQLQLLAATNVDTILSLCRQYQPKIMVIDSIQTMFCEHLQSAPGSVAQVRESAAALVRFAKQSQTTLLLVGHVTKEGALAGPRVLEHIVDTVLYFEGQRDNRFRLVRAVKNRFGAVNELGVFMMADDGLRQVTNPSAIFLSRQQACSGSVVMATWEGTRPLLVEVQALVDASHLANPRRVCVGMEHNRLAMLLAVLNRHAGVPTFDQDVFANIVGGIRIQETGVDLALLFAIVSSLRDRVVAKTCVVFGEVGLTGELRPVQCGLERLREAQKLGFKQAIVPKANAPKTPLPGIEVLPASTLNQALAHGLE